MSNWKNYEDVARHLIRQCGKEFGSYDVEGKQEISRSSVTTWDLFNDRSKIIIRLFIFITLLIIVSVNYGLCETYKWKNDDGSISFTDEFSNIPEKYRDKVEVKTFKSNEYETSKKSTKSEDNNIETDRESEQIQSQQAKLNNMALKRTVEYVDLDKQLIKRLIKTHDFQTLEKLYEKMLQQYKLDEKYEMVLSESYHLLFFTENNELTGISVQDLDTWVSKTESYIAYTARGVYKAEQGYAMRGGKTIDKTPSINLKGMQRLHNEAAKDLETGISKNPLIMPAYSSLIGIAKTSNMPFTAKQILLKAEENDKKTFLVRYNYIRSLLPQWGGSFEEMSEYSKQVLQYNNLNPRLWSLQGEADAERAYDYYREKNYSAAIVAFTNALKFGDRIYWLKKRAECYDKMAQRGKSAADYEKIRFYKPNFSTAK